MDDDPNLPRRVSEEKMGVQEVIRKSPTRYEEVLKNF